nr:tetratricopeptide repeat protein [bacterium]
FSGRSRNAERLCRRAIPIWENAFGDEHPILAKPLEDYAMILRRMGREDKAHTLELRAKKIRSHLPLDSRSSPAVSAGEYEPNPAQKIG